MKWMPPETARDQLVLFKERLDDVIGPDHSVRWLVRILDKIDWAEWEASYSQQGAGRPPIHPKVLASVILYGLLVRIRSSRQLEEALTMRVDFLWLAEGRKIDHSTICIFRRAHPEKLKSLFVQLGLVARSAGLMNLKELAFDGTKIRSNNRRSAKEKTENLRELREELQNKYDEFVEQAEALDSETLQKETEQTTAPSSLESRLNGIDRALETLEQLEEEGKSIPNRLPTTDTDSRVTLNKEGGFGPNYTPTAAVDTETGLIASADVISGSNEKAALPPALDQIKKDFDAVPERLLADGIFNHGTNLAEMERRDIELYSPVKELENNPAIRDDITQAVPEENWGDLPTTTKNKKTQLDKAAFIYDKKNDIYRCPMGEALEYKSTSTKKNADGTTNEIRKYLSSEAKCHGCPLLELCHPDSKKRQVGRDQYEELRNRLAVKMSTTQGQEIYARRMGPGERPFAVIKHIMGARQFLMRGLARVKQEWLWLTTAFNLKRLMALLPRPAPN